MRSICNRVAFAISLLFLIRQTGLSSGYLFAQNTYVNIEVNREREFEGEGLYGFMNGGSELYLEYGFQHLQVLDVTYKGEDYSIEIYTMSDAESAFGIYSVHTFRCIVADSLSRYECYSRYQLQSVRGNKYISIVYKRPYTGIKIEAKELMDYYNKAEDPDNYVIIPTALGVEGAQISSRVKLMYGPISVNNSLHSINDLVKGFEIFKVWSYKRDDNKTKVLIIRDKQDGQTLITEEHLL